MRRSLSRAVRSRGRMNARPASWLVWLGVVVAMAATARLGLWQLDRAAQKTAIGQAWRERAQLEPLPGSQLPREPADRGNTACIGAS